MPSDTSSWRGCGCDRRGRRAWRSSTAWIRTSTRASSPPAATSSAGSCRGSARRLRSSILSIPLAWRRSRPGCDAIAPMDPDHTELPLDQPAAMREEERIDPARIEPFLRDALGGAGPVSVLQFPKGHSNLTYLVRVGEREAVLRRAPFGVKVKSAHDMKREYDILSALQGVYPRAPKVIRFCEDESLIGAKFYLMERVRGVILRGDTAPPGIAFSPELLRKTSTSLVDNLAGLHAVDVTRGPLSAIGRPRGYVARQVTGWTERYRNAKTDEIRGVEAASTWLARNMPAESGAAVIHNDYKYDNVVLDPKDPTRVLSVLDWEMATVGDPLM